MLIFFKQTIGRTPENMTDISIVPQDKDKIYFEEDDVLQLQCIAEVENINGMNSKVHYILLLYYYYIIAYSDIYECTCISELENMAS